MSTDEVPQPGAVHSEGESVPAPVTSAENPSAAAAPISTPNATEAQPASLQPAGETPAGISSVAQFLPADAKLDHSTPSPSQLLDEGVTNGNVDITMADATQEVAKDDLPGQPELESTSATETHVNGVTAPSEMSATAGQSIVSETPQSPPRPAAPNVNGQVTLPNDDLPAKPVTDGDIPVTSSEFGSDRPTQDSLPAGVVRPRDEDETDEPSAKRTKTDVPDTVKTEFKRPDLPLTAPLPANGPSTTAPPPTNGNAGQLPAKPAFSSARLTHAQKKILEDKMKNTKKVKSAAMFLRPVDPVALNIPAYPQIIKHPMDLGTMENKLRNDEYVSLDAFVNDFELMVNNCFTFNGPAHLVSVQAQNLRAYFLKQMETVPSGEVAAATLQKSAKKSSPAAPKMPRRESRTSVPAASVGAARSPPANDTFALLPGGTPMIRRDSTAGRPKRAVVPPAPRDLPYSGIKPKRKENQVGLKFCEFVLDELRKPKYDKYTYLFREPVDPVALNIPHYFSIIKTPMDMGTITNKLKNGQYSTAEEFKADFDLMLANCFKFNPADNAVHVAGKDLQRELESLWTKKNAWVKKNQPSSQRVSSASEGESDADESEDEEEDAERDTNEETIRMLREQLANMQNMISTIGNISAKRSSPKAGSKKKNRTSGGSKIKKSSTSAPVRATSKSKPKKQRLVTYDEKQEISNATENMTEVQVGKLTQIITENVSKYKDMAGDDVELEIDDLPNDVQHKLLKYVRSIFPRQRASPEEEIAVDDDYEPERTARSGGAKKKHKPMKKHEQESRIAALKQTMEQMQGGITSATEADSRAARPSKHDSSSDEDSESSEEE